MFFICKLKSKTAEICKISAYAVKMICDLPVKRSKHTTYCVASNLEPYMIDRKKIAHAEINKLMDIEIVIEQRQY